MELSIFIYDILLSKASIGKTYLLKVGIISNTKIVCRPLIKMSPMKLRKLWKGNCQVGLSLINIKNFKLNSML